MQYFSLKLCQSDTIWLAKATCFQNSDFPLWRYFFEMRKGFFRCIFLYFLTRRISLIVSFTCQGHVLNAESACEEYALTKRGHTDTDTEMDPQITTLLKGLPLRQLRISDMANLCSVISLIWV